MFNIVEKIFNDLLYSTIEKQPIRDAIRLNNDICQ